MNIESSQEKLAEFCNNISRQSFTPAHRSGLLALLKMTENLRDVVCDKINAVDRQKPHR